MEKKLLNYTIITALSLIGLDLLGYFLPGSLNWGFHFLGFLPSFYLILYIGLAAITFYLFYTGKLEQLFTFGSKAINNKPQAVLIAAIFTFIIFAILFRIKASVLGDSFNMIFNFRDFSGRSIPFLPPWHEPLSMYVLYHAVRLIGSISYPQIFTSFFIVEVVFGILFVITTFYLVKNLFESPLQRFMTFILLMVLPYMEFYFGYIEVYAVSTLLFSIFALVSILALKDKIPFYYVPVVWTLLTFSHYINGLLGLSVLYLGYFQYQKGKKKEIYLGAAISATIVLIAFIVANFDIERLINISPISHFLSFSGNISAVNVYSQAYTIFSVYHFIEILNYLIMMAPLVLLIIFFYGSLEKWNIFIGSSLNLWFTISLAPVFAYYLIAKLEQGNASDWDAFGGQFYLLALFAAVIFFQKENQFATKIFSLIISISLLQSLPWFSVNASKEASISRFYSLWNPKILSHLGNYTHALRLFRYYESEKDSIEQINIWERYKQIRPGDPRSYINELQAINLYTPNDYDKKIQTYEQWFRLDPANDSLRYALSSACVNAGNKYFGEGKFDKAKIFYFKAILADSASSRAYNNLGSLYAQEGKLDTAIFLFSRAIKIDTLYAEAFYNIGTANIDRGKTKAGIKFIRRAAQLGIPQAQQYLTKQNK